MFVVGLIVTLQEEQTKLPQTVVELTDMLALAPCRPLVLATVYYR